MPCLGDPNPWRTAELRRAALGHARQAHLAARRLHRLHRRGRCGGELDGQLRLELAMAEEAGRRYGIAHQPGRMQRRGGDGGARIEPAAVDRRLDAADIDDLVFDAEQVLEAALGQAAMQRHLAALEALDAHAGARLLAFDAAAGGLVEARADAAAEPLLAPARPRIVADFIELHIVIPVRAARV